ncbi:MAG: methylenetetrahydrofolate--tRNA-(uracil(54)-C(5))-methyltransferase (FADH(2)-oxidizing) TrmFO [Clostridia bacterium]|nr:methylenetetrahydrofolate--tRNA-(uracil(54)-C(5))-methyltransferase (FADH(2)-oxidizing) TrmFO [Clostridia bacterium]
MAQIKVIGAGLAGCEAAYAAARMGVDVILYEMKPQKYSPAHKSPLFGELVCSNSLKAKQINNASGVIKEELRILGSLIMQAADKAEVPAGGALAVDRDIFSQYITDAVRNHPRITVVECEIDSFDDSITVCATGPLTSDKMASYIADNIGGDMLHFFDAAAPIVDASSIDRDKVFAASRYGKGEASYLNCPMTKEEYDAFYDALINARVAPLHDFDRASPQVFEGCMPVEIMASRGYDTLRFGPLKPVGLPDPKTGVEPYAVVQLRQENLRADMYNLVGFQTNLTFDEQKRVFGLIPGLEKASFHRYGVMHRNTFLNSPQLLNADYSMREKKNIFFAGQMTGVEGYLESTSSGMVAGINAARRALGLDSVIFPPTTVIGALASYISDPNVTSFQPMNANFGVMASLDRKVKGGKKARHEAIGMRAVETMRENFSHLFDENKEN